jgi:hypothetical protein
MKAFRSVMTFYLCMMFSAATAAALCWIQNIKTMRQLLSYHWMCDSGCRLVLQLWNITLTLISSFVCTWCVLLLKHVRRQFKMLCPIRSVSSSRHQHPMTYKLYQPEFLCQLSFVLCDMLAVIIECGISPDGISYTLVFS